MKGMEEKFTKKELHFLKTSMERFKKRCLEVCRRLKVVDFRFEYMEYFTVDEENDEVYCEGIEYDHNWIDVHSQSFPLKYLYDEDALTQAINDFIVQKEIEKQQLELKRQNELEAKERLEYERLKKIYG